MVNVLYTINGVYSQYVNIVASQAIEALLYVVDVIFRQSAAGQVPMKTCASVDMETSQRDQCLSPRKIFK